MKKVRGIYLPFAATLVILASSILTYRVFSVYSPPPLEDPNPTYTLELPDQEYAISARDLAALESDLIIPSLDDAVPRITYDPDHGVIKSVTSPLDYVIDLDNLAAEIELAKQTGELALKPTFTTLERYSNNLASYNLQLNKIYRTPLNISLKDGSDLATLPLDTKILRAILTPSSLESNVPPDINKDLLIGYVSQRLTPKQKKYFSGEAVYQNTKLAINSRFMGDATPAVLGVDDGPSSRGELSARYLEVDLSQQKMYFFIDHTLYKEYRVSTGFEYPTPVGEFHILNKAPKAFSQIYNVWMPYWMGFKYAGDVGAYLGLHEIAYAVDAKGKPVYRHGYYIGDMMTGGCIAMEPKDSREIYNLSEVGMLVRVVP